MQIAGIVGIVVAVVGVAAGVVQVIDYLEKKRKKSSDQSRNPKEPAKVVLSDAYAAFEIGYCALMIFVQPSNVLYRDFLVQLCKKFGTVIDYKDTDRETLPDTMRRVFATLAASHGPAVAGYFQLSYNGIVIMRDLSTGTKPALGEYQSLVGAAAIPSSLKKAFAITWRDIQPNIDGANDFLRWINQVREFLKTKAQPDNGPGQA